MNTSQESEIDRAATEWATAEMRRRNVEAWRQLLVDLFREHMPAQADLAESMLGRLIADSFDVRPVEFHRAALEVIRESLKTPEQRASDKQLLDLPAQGQIQ